MNDSFSMIADGSAQELLAANLRRLRIARHLSLSELARATNMSKATLSGVENARANPTIGTLASLAAALGVSMTELLDELPLGEIRIARASDAAFGSPDGLFRRVLEAIPPGGGVEVTEIALGPRQLQEVDARPDGARASVFVLEGTLIAGPVERSTELGTGDYMAFPADVPHLYNTGRRAARALVLSQSPT